jgi:hypothetical protein
MKSDNRPASDVTDLAGVLDELEGLEADSEDYRLCAIGSFSDAFRWRTASPTATAAGA